MGIIVIILGSQAMTEANTFEREAALFQEVKIGSASTILLITGCLSVFLAAIGFVGAYRGLMAVLKMFTLFMFVVLILQWAMGGFIISVNPDKNVARAWDNAVLEGDPNDRVDYQDFLNCCGWQTTSDAVGVTDCPDPGVVKPCKQATIDWIHSHVQSVAEICVALACIELIGLIATLIITFTAEKSAVDDFDPFHY